MELWNTLADITANYTTAWAAVVVGVGLAAVIAVATFTLFESGKWLFVAWVLASAGILGGTGLASNADGAADEQRGDAIASYLASERDLMVLDPIEVDLVENQATTAAYTADGELVDVTVRWLDFDTKPHDPSDRLPANHDPISVILTPRDAQ